MRQHLNYGFALGDTEEKNLNTSVPRPAFCDAASVAIRAGRLQGLAAELTVEDFGDVAGVLVYRTIWR